MSDGMNGNSSASEARSRHACEPCRRKKTKCTAERPVCSICQRAKQRCLYLPREQSKTGRSSSGISKTMANKERFQLLESRMNDIMRILQPLSNDDDESPHDTERIRHESTGDPSIFQLSRIASSSSLAHIPPMPPIEVLQHLVEVYTTVLHFQPLPLFDPKQLLTQLTIFPQYLIWSFLALTLTFTSHAYYQNKHADAAELYASMAKDVVMKEVAEGLPKREVVQSLCLLALKDVKACQPARAWMTIGTASRLESLRKLTYRQSSGIFDDGDSDSKCYWSVFILERMFWVPLSNLPEIGKAWEYPASATVPLSVPQTDNNGSTLDLLDSEETFKDFGVNKYCLEMISIWGKTSTYLHKIRLNEVDAPWLPESDHAKLCVELFEREAQLPQKHLIRNVALPRRSAMEILEQQEYWRPWLIMQVVSHAVPAILNHPFLHLVAIRGKLSAPSSRLFLQQTVDLTLYHSGWVSRLVSICEDLLFEIYDPLIGHLIAATATIPWFFQFAGDHKVSKKAEEDFRKCEGLLSRMSLTWPHIRRKLEIVNNLRDIADRQLRTATEKCTTITFPPSLIWRLLDPDISQMTHTNPNTTEGAPGSHDQTDTRVRVTAHFVHPLSDRENEQSSPFNFVPDSFDSLSASSTNFEQLSVHDLFTNFALDDFQM